MRTDYRSGQHPARPVDMLTEGSGVGTVFVGRERNDKSERAALTFHTAHPDRSPHLLHNPPRDRQPQASPAIAAGGGGIDRQRQWHRFQLQPTGFELGEVEDLIDEPKQGPPEASMVSRHSSWKVLTGAVRRSWVMPSTPFIGVRSS